MIILTILYDNVINMGADTLIGCEQGSRDKALIAAATNRAACGALRRGDDMGDGFIKAETSY